jgi:transposase
LETAQHYHTSFSEIQHIFNHHCKYKTAINLYARRYAAIKLKQAGMSAPQMSKILGISENHIYKLLKAQVDLSEATGWPAYKKHEEVKKKG